MEDENDAEEEEWKQDDGEETDGGSRSSYRKNKWRLVAVWTDIEKQEALRRAGVIMTEDFMIGGGSEHEYADPADKKIGPYGYRNVSIGLIYLIYLSDKEF